MLLNHMIKCSLLLLCSCASAQQATNSTSPATDNTSEVNVVHSLLFLAIPVMICITIVTFAARKVYIACSPRLPENEALPEKSFDKDEFCTSLDTTDSIEDITFADNKVSGSGSWNPFKKYSNVAKTEAVTPDDGDVELGMKSKPIALGTVSKQEVQRSPHPTNQHQHKQQHGFSRVSAYPSEGVMSVQSLGTVVRV